MNTKDLIGPYVTKIEKLEQTSIDTENVEMKEKEAFKKYQAAETRAKKLYHVFIFIIINLYRKE